MREDAKIRFGTPRNRQAGGWRSYADQCALAPGTSPGRISPTKQGILLWNFFTPRWHRTGMSKQPDGRHRKRLVRIRPAGTCVLFVRAVLELQVDDRQMSNRSTVLKRNSNTATLHSSGHASIQRWTCRLYFCEIKYRTSTRQTLRCFRFGGHSRTCSAHEGKCGYAFRLDARTFRRVLPVRSLVQRGRSVFPTVVGSGPWQ